MLCGRCTAENGLEKGGGHTQKVEIRASVDAGSSMERGHLSVILNVHCYLCNLYAKCKGLSIYQLFIVSNKPFHSNILFVMVKHFPIPRCNILTFYIKSNQKTNALVDLGGTPGTHPLGVQILSFSCSFRQKICKIIPIWELAHSPGENPGSATVIYQKTMHQQWRIQDFRGSNPSAWAENLLFEKIFAEYCMKIKDIGPRGGARPWRPHWVCK